MIELDIHKRWGSFSLDVQLRHQGGILGLLGASGCGKSKTLQCIAGIERPDAGKIVVGTRTFSTANGRSTSLSRSGAWAICFSTMPYFPI